MHIVYLSIDILYNIYSLLLYNIYMQCVCMCGYVPANKLTLFVAILTLQGRL